MEKELRKISRESLPAWAKDVPSGFEVIFIPKDATRKFTEGLITADEYKKIVDECEIVIVE